MGVTLTAEEQELVKQGKLDPNNIMEYRKLHPVRTINVNELDQIKLEIKQAMQEYKDSIQRNKDLYNELAANRKKKEECRNKLTELRNKKKKVLGLVE
jgi:Zn-dependent oligopeptidase